MRAIRDLGATDNVHPPAHQIAHSAGSNGAHDHRPSSDRVPSASASEAPSPAEAPPNPAPAAPPGATQPPRVPGAQRQVPPVAGRGGVGSSGASGDERGDESASGSASGRGSSGGPGGGLVRRRSRRLSSLVRAVPDASSPAARGLYEFATDPRSRGPAAGVAAAAGAHVGVSVDVAASLDSRVVDSVDLGVRGSIRAPGNPALTRSRQSHHRGPSDPLAESAAASSVASMIDMASEHPHGASGSPSAAPLFVGIGRLSGEGNHSGSHAWTGALASSVASTASRWGTRPSPRYAAAPGGPWGASDPASSEEDAAGDSVAGKEVDAPSISGGAAGGIRRRRSIKARAGEGGEREGEGGEGLGAGVSIQGVRAPVSPSTRLRQSRRGGAGQMSADGPGAERQGREGDGGEWGGSFAGGGDVTSSLVVGSAPVWFGAAGKGIPSPGSPRKGIR